MASAVSAMLGLCLAVLLCTASAQSLTFMPTNATGPYGTRVTGAPIGLIDVSMQTATLGPCVLRTLHTHAATELLYVTQGSILSIQFRANGTLLASNLTAGAGGPQGVIYPALLPHLQYNPTCEPATFTASFPVLPSGIVTVNLNASRLVQAINMTSMADPASLASVTEALVDISLAMAGGPIPAGYSGSGPFTPVAAATFAFPAFDDLKRQHACLKRCNLA